jgi:hypothetical protein
MSKTKEKSCLSSELMRADSKELIERIESHPQGRVYAQYMFVECHVESSPSLDSKKTQNKIEKAGLLLREIQNLIDNPMREIRIYATKIVNNLKWLLKQIDEIIEDKDNISDDMRDLILYLHDLDKKLRVLNLE